MSKITKFDNNCQLKKSNLAGIYGGKRIPTHVQYYEGNCCVDIFDYNKNGNDVITKIERTCSC